VDASGTRPHDGVDVAILRWPADADKRVLLASAGRPRLLLLEHGAEPPAAVDDREDWVTEGTEHNELLHRIEALHQRTIGQRPHLDEDGLLRHRGRWVAITDAQLPVVARLVEEFGKVVSTDELAQAYRGAGGAAKDVSIRTALKRLRRRVAEVGLVLHAVRNRGVMLDDGKP
jgi:hypothetical protein